MLEHEENTVRYAVGCSVSHTRYFKEFKEFKASHVGRTVATRDMRSHLNFLDYLEFLEFFELGGCMRSVRPYIERVTSGGRQEVMFSLSQTTSQIAHTQRSARIQAGLVHFLVKN